MSLGRQAESQDVDPNRETVVVVPWVVRAQAASVGDRVRFRLLEVAGGGQNRSYRSTAIGIDPAPARLSQ